MSQYLNSAAIESWREIKQAIDQPLQTAFQRSGLSDSDRRLMISEMLRNSLDHSSDDANVSVPTRIGR